MVTWFQAPVLYKMHNLAKHFQKRKSFVIFKFSFGKELRKFSVRGAIMLLVPRNVRVITKKKKKKE